MEEGRRMHGGEERGKTEVRRGVEREARRLMRRRKNNKTVQKEEREEDGIDIHRNSTNL